jgi:phosphotransferase system  glucose/maltose/N-acetylglucosamine-specific IIC component
LAEQPGGSVTLTPVRALVVAAIFGGLGGWLVVVTANAFDAVPPRIPWTAPVGLAVFAALVGVLAWTTHQRIQVRRERMEASRAVAFLVLGKASALAGALVAGGYLGFALLFLSNIDASSPRERVIRSAVALVAGVGLCLTGLRLERACKVPGADDDDEPPDPSPTR